MIHAGPAVDRAQERHRLIGRHRAALFGDEMEAGLDVALGDRIEWTRAPVAEIEVGIAAVGLLDSPRRDRGGDGRARAGYVGGQSPHRRARGASPAVRGRRPLGSRAFEVVLVVWLPNIQAGDCLNPNLPYSLYYFSGAGFLKSLVNTIATRRLAAADIRHATAPRPFFATSVSSFNEAPRGRFSPRSHWLTRPVVTLR